MRWLFRKKILHPDGGKNLPIGYRKAPDTHFRPGIESLAFDPGTSLPLLRMEGAGRAVGSMGITQPPQVMVNQQVLPQGTPVALNNPTFDPLSNPQNLQNIDQVSTYGPEVAAIELM